MSHPALAMMIDDDQHPVLTLRDSGPAPTFDRPKRADESWAEYRTFVLANVSPGLKRGCKGPAQPIDVYLGLRDAEDGDMNGTGARSCG